MKKRQITKRITKNAPRPALDSYVTLNYSRLSKHPCAIEYYSELHFLNQSFESSKCLLHLSLPLSALVLSQLRLATEKNCENFEISELRDLVCSLDAAQWRARPTPKNVLLLPVWGFALFLETTIMRFTISFWKEPLV